MGFVDKILTNPVKDLDALFTKGEALCRQGYYGDAIDLMEKLLAAEPGKARASQLKGYALYQLGSFEEALQYFDQALRIDPYLPDALVYKGLIYSNLGKHSLALTLYERALALHPGFVQAWYAKGLTLAIQEKYDEAIIAYERVLGLDPRHMDALIGISVARKKVLGTRKDSRLLKHPKEQLAEKPGPVRTPEVLARPPASGFGQTPDAGKVAPAVPVAEHQNTVVVSTDQIAQVIAGHPASAPEIEFPFSSRTGIVEEKPEPVPEPVVPRSSTYEDLISEIDQDPERIPVPERWYVLGSLYSKTGQYRAAVLMFEQFVEGKEDNAEGWRSLADARKKIGLYDDALIAYDQALVLDPDHTGAWINRAKNLVMLGDHEEALVSCDQAIARDGSSADAYAYREFVLKKMLKSAEKNLTGDEILGVGVDNTRLVKKRARGS